MVDSDPAIAAQGKVWQGFWRLADPKISITSLACMAVGGAVVARHGSLHWGWLAVTGAALFAMEVAKNAWGDVFDFDAGTDQRVLPEDRTDFSGGKRVLVDGLLTRRQTWAMAFGFGALGVLLGVAIVQWRAPEAMWLGLVGLLLGWSYHGPPLRLCYRGLGELDVLLCYGPLVALATSVVQTRAWSWEVVRLSLPLGVFTAAFLLANEFPDYRADLASAKRNLVVRLGRRRASRLLPAVYALGFGLVALLPWAGHPPLVLLGLLPLPLAVWLCRQVRLRPEDFHRGVPVQPAALGVFAGYALLAAVGTVLG
ncbi:MAG: prenyltransferase [Planctomycetes bacterium]|nr:prenyltransferase [Planctomycetota bacterium]